MAIDVSDAASYHGLVVSTHYYLDVGDYVELIAYQNSGVSLNVVFEAGDESPVFGMVKLP